MAKDETRRTTMKRVRPEPKGSNVNGYDEIMAGLDRAAWWGVKAGAKWSVLAPIGLGRLALAGLRALRAQRAHDDLITRRARRLGRSGKD